MTSRLAMWASSCSSTARNRFGSRRRTASRPPCRQTTGRRVRPKTTALTEAAAGSTTTRGVGATPVAVHSSVSRARSSPSGSTAASGMTRLRRVFHRGSAAKSRAATTSRSSGQAATCHHGGAGAHRDRQKREAVTWPEMLSEVFQ